MNFFFITIVGKALGKAGIPKRLTMRSIGNPKVGGYYSSYLSFQRLYLLLHHEALSNHRNTTLLSIDICNYPTICHHRKQELGNYRLESSREFLWSIWKIFIFFCGLEYFVFCFTLYMGKKIQYGVWSIDVGMGLPQFFNSIYLSNGGVSAKAMGIVWMYNFIRPYFINDIFTKN